MKERVRATAKKNSAVRRYTAQEMRETAKSIETSLVMSPLNEIDGLMFRLIAMFRQAADDLEREEKREWKYEYAEKFKEGMVAFLHRERPVDHCEMYPGSIAVRRKVGDWEEVAE